MAEDAGRGVGSSVNLLEVGAADAACGNLHQEFAGADAGNGNCLHAHIVHAAVDGSPHGGRNLCRPVDEFLLAFKV
jgi:hypothetical protein